MTNESKPEPIYDEVFQDEFPAPARRTLQVFLRNPGMIEILQVISTAGPNGNEHESLISKICGSTISTRMQITGEEWDAINDALLGKAKGRTTQEVITYRVESQQLYASLASMAMLITSMAQDDDTVAGLLSSLDNVEISIRFIRLIRLLATATVIQLADRFDISDATDRIKNGHVTPEQIVHAFVSDVSDI